MFSNFGSWKCYSTPTILATAVLVTMIWFPDWSSHCAVNSLHTERTLTVVRREVARLTLQLTLMVFVDFPILGNEPQTSSGTTLKDVKSLYEWFISSSLFLVHSVLRSKTMKSWFKRNVVRFPPTIASSTYSPSYGKNITLNKKV